MNSNNKIVKKEAKKEAKREVKREIRSELRKDALTAPRVTVPKNMRGNQQVKTSNNLQASLMACNRAFKKPEEHLPHDVSQYVKLLDNPFTAEWGGDGEVPVRPPVYETTVPPAATEVMRCFGTTDFEIAAGNVAWFVCGAGPMNLAANEGANSNQLYSADYDVHYANWNYVRVSDTPTYEKYTFGAPYDARSSSTGLGVFGYGYQGSSYESAPIADPYTNRLLGSGATPSTGGPSILQWANTETLGPMTPDSPGIYSYRPIACGVRVIPLDSNLHVGGAIDSALVPTGSNEQYATSIAGTPTAGGATRLMGLPNHVVKRGNAIHETKWLPGQNDYAFYQTNDSSISMSADAEKYCLNARKFIRIVPGDTTAASRYRIQYVAFYEITGATVSQVSSVPRPLPNAGAKVVTAIANVTQQDLNESVRKSQVQDATIYEAAKDQPGAIGGMLAKTETHKEAKGLFDTILSGLKSAAEFAAPLIPLIL